MTRWHLVGGAFSGVAVVASPGFGAPQAPASPAPGEALQSCDTPCSRVCRAAGFIGASAATA